MNCLPKLMVLDLISDRIDVGLNSPAARQDVQNEPTESAKMNSTDVKKSFLVRIINS